MATISQDIVELVYEGPLEEEPWSQLLHLLRERVGAVATSLNCPLPGPNEQGFDVTVCDWDVRVLREHYAADYHLQNPFPHQQLRPGGAYRWSDFVDAETFHASGFFEHFCRPLGYEFALCLCLESPLGGRAWLHAVRDSAAGDFTPDTLRWFEALAPHFHRALRLFHKIKQLENERVTFETAIHQLQIGTVVLDRHGEVLSVNRSAQTIVENNAGLAIVRRRLRLKSSESQVRFQQTLGRMLQARATVQAEAFAITRAGRPPLGILMRAFPHTPRMEVEPRPALILYITDPESPQLPAEQLLRSLFGLSGAEARLTTLLVSGLKLAEAAAAMQISEGSTRIYCKRVFAKMGVSRQVELVKLVLQSVVPLAGTIG